MLNTDDIAPIAASEIDLYSVPELFKISASLQAATEVKRGKVRNSNL
jgi:hypothetical protein